MLKRKQAYLSMLLVLVFLTLSSMPVFATDIQAAYAKIPEDLLEAFNSVGSNGTLDVIVWLEDDSTEEYRAIVSNIPEPSFESNVANIETYGIQSVANNKSNLSDEERMAQIEAMQNFIMQKRQIAQAVYLEDNTAIANQLAETGGEIVYVSRYSSMVICNVTLSEAVDMAMCNSVLSLENGSGEGSAEMSVSVPTVGMDVAQSLGGSAEGIVLGMIEFDGVVDKTFTCFDGLENKIHNINAIEGYTPDATAHASLVAAIMVGNEAGIAQGFESLYCAPATHTFSSLYTNTEELLSLGVNIINISAGWTYKNQYHESCKWFDHIAYNHSVHIVKSSGNSGSGGVTAPGMAYNVITVGNTYDRGTADILDDELYSYSSYNISENDVAYKPDLCAPGCLIDIPDASGFIGVDSRGNEYDMETQGAGTSNSAPHVSGIIAVLCSYEPILLVKQALLKSILLSSVSIQTQHNYDTQPDSSGNVSTGYRMYGSGIVNAYNAMMLIDSGNYIAGTISSREGHDSISIGNLQQGQTVSITLSFLKRGRFNGTDHYNPDNISGSDLADLDLFICPVGTYVGGDCSKTSNHTKSITANNNVEKIIFTAAYSGEHIICINKHANEDYHDIVYGVSWLIHNDSLQ